MLEGLISPELHLVIKIVGRSRNVPNCLRFRSASLKQLSVFHIRNSG